MSAAVVALLSLSMSMLSHTLGGAGQASDSALVLADSYSYGYMYAAYGEADPTFEMDGYSYAYADYSDAYGEQDIVDDDDEEDEVSEEAPYVTETFLGRLLKRGGGKSSGKSSRTSSAKK